MEERRFFWLYLIQEAAQVVVRVWNIIREIKLGVVFFEFELEVQTVEVQQSSLLEDLSISLAMNVGAPSMPSSIFLIAAYLHSIVVLPASLPIVENRKPVVPFGGILDFEIEPAGVAWCINIIVK